jgi:hypothetical protein
MTATDWMTATDGYAEHGPHLPRLRTPILTIHWMPASSPEDRRRELRWTCDCRSVVYTLVSAGGQAFIERRGGWQDAVHSPRMRAMEASAVWELLLTGRAR